jgi:myo-inositol-1(or 4)-monophosphatase
MSSFEGSPFRLDSREVLATNGLVKDEIIAVFSNIFAGRDLSPLPSVSEVAAKV